MTPAEEEFAEARPGPGRKEVLGKLSELLDRSGIEVDEIAKINRVNLWQGFYKDDEGDAHTVDMAGVQFVPTWADGPKWPVIHQADPVKLNVRPLKPIRLDGWKRAYVFPDIQIGFRQLRDQESGELYLDPFHDESAIACAMAVLRVVRPDVVIFLGDCLDLPAQSKYVQEPSWQLTTQDALNRFHRLLSEVRSLLPEAEIVVLEGNHDLRLPKSVMVNAATAFGLTRANLPKEWPVLSVPHLCRFDELNVTYASGYPANEYWLSESLACIHGRLTGNATKSAASRVVEDERVSIVYGHTHAVEMRQKTRRVHGGNRTSFAASPGCLCRIDGAVPSVKGGIDPWGRPLQSYENWQQGAAVITYEKDGNRHNYEQLSIYEGWTVYRDRFYGEAA